VRVYTVHETEVCIQSW